MNNVSPEAAMIALGGTTIRPPLMFGRLRVLSMDDVITAEPRDYLLKGMMSAGEMSVWWGVPKCGKSFLMLHVAYGIAQGRSVLGKRVKPCPVLYIAAEGQAGLSARLRAIRKQYSDAKQFHFIAQPVDLLHPESDFDSVRKAARHVGAKLIVVDTLSRAIAGGDENNPVDMGRFIVNIGALVSDTGAHVAVIHHGTKDRNNSTPRGHSSLVGAADLVVEVAKAAGGNRTATVTAAKDDPDGAAMPFSLRVVELGTDMDGDPITTCAVDEATVVISTGPKLTNRQKRANQFLADLIVAEGKPLPSGCPNKLLGVRVDRWREECESRGLSTATEKDSRTTAFRRVNESLLDNGTVATRDGIVWLTRAPDFP